MVLKFFQAFFSTPKCKILLFRFLNYHLWLNEEIFEDVITASELLHLHYKAIYN